MPVLDTKQDIVKAYTLSHGLDLALKTDGQYQGECPRCGKEVFRVSPADGQWNCRRCEQGGNLYTFLRWIHELGTTRHLANGRTVQQKYQEFADNRSLLSPETLKTWGVFLHPITHKWVVPAYDGRGEIMNLYTYDKPAPDKKPILMSTAGCKAQLFGMQFFDRRKSCVYLAESYWDALALWEVMTHVKHSQKGYFYTDQRNLSMEASTNIIAVPGSVVFDDSWCEYLNHKEVTLLYHSDHPRPRPDGSMGTPAGHWGLRNVVNKITANDCTPSRVEYLHWGEAGYDPERKNGYDVRDYLTGEE